MPLLGLRPAGATAWHRHKRPHVLDPFPVCLPSYALGSPHPRPLPAVRTARSPLHPPSQKVDLSSTDTGFNLSPADQLAFIQYLADTAHSLGLAFSLKVGAAAAPRPNPHRQPRLDPHAGRQAADR
jgi:hypothetical protein